MDIFSPTIIDNAIITGSNNASLLQVSSPSAASAFFISGSGRVGIGTTSPLSTFTVEGGNINIGAGRGIGGNFVGTYTSFITYHNDGLGFLQSASFGFRGSAYMDSISYPDAFGFGTNDLRFFTSTNGIAAPSEIMRMVGSTGFVGIGETSPSAKLEIRGSGATSATTALRVENSNTSASLVVTNDIRVGINKTTPNSELDVNGTVIVTGSIHIQLGSGFTGQMIANGNNFDLRNSSSGTHISMLNSNSTILSQVVTTQNGLNVTPGANSTTAGLTVTSGSYPAATLLRVGVNTLVVTGSNVGIGTTTPTQKLDVTGGDIIVDTNNGLTFRSTSGFVKYNGSQLFNVSADAFDTNGYFRVRDNTGLNTRFIVLDGGNVGIGTTSPNARLHISGANNGALLIVSSSAAPSALFVSGSGNVGIGTTTPSASLHVQGNFQISTGSLYTYGQNTDIDSGSIRTVMSVSTGSYRAAFFDYVLNKSTNARAGTVFSVWNGASVEWNDVSTNDIGNTAEVNLSVGLSGANVLLYASSSTNDWSVKALARML